MVNCDKTQKNHKNEKNEKYMCAYYKNGQIMIISIFDIVNNKQIEH